MNKFPSPSHQNRVAKMMNRRDFIINSASYGSIGMAILPVLSSHLAGVAYADSGIVEDDTFVKNLLEMTPEEMIAENIDVYANFSRFRASKPLNDWQTCELIAGALPSFLSGSFLIASPNPHRFIDADPELPQTNADRGAYHWFDGDCLVQAVQINDGSCKFTARQVETAKIAYEEANPSFPSDGLATGFGAAFGPNDQNTNAYKMMIEGDSSTVNTANTMLSAHGGQLLAGWYFGPGAPYALDITRTLATVGQYQFPVSPTADEETKRLAPYTSKHMAAHTKVCAYTGEMICYTNFQSVLPMHPKEEFQNAGIKSSAVYVSIINPSGELKKSFEIPLPGPRHIHDIAVTENYILVFNTPSRPPFGSYQDSEGNGDQTQIGVLRRDGTKTIQWFDVTSSYILHTGNAFEVPETNSIVLTATRVENTVNSERFKDLDIPQIANTVFKAHFFRWELNLDNQTVTENFLIEADLPDSERTMTEFPVVPQALIGKKNRYTYMQRLQANKTIGLDAIIKFTEDTGAYMLRTFDEIFSAPTGEHYFGSEAQFVPGPNWSPGENEDDGWLLLFGTRERNYGPLLERSQTELWVLDAKNLDAVARVRCGDRFPKGFHSLWIGSNANAQHSTAVGLV